MSSLAQWTTPACIRARLQALWDSGRLLAERLGGVASFPLELALRQPTAAQMGERFGEVQAWIRALEEGARPATEHGYEIGWREINHRQLGRQRVPDKVRIRSLDDALRMLNRLRDAREVERLAGLTLARFPVLGDWLLRCPMTLHAHAPDWARVLACLEWFAQHPRSGMYLRQLDIAEVDTKFIESRKALLAELLDLILPPQAIEPLAMGARQFERRYGLAYKMPTLRFRMLDATHAIGGMTDLSTTVAQFAALRPDERRVYVTENEINGLAFPPVPDAMVILGGGYGVERLAEVAWLADRDLIYWGDIDTHGFAILDRLRTRFPHTRSLMMDSATLHAHRALWGVEEKGKRYLGDLQSLSFGEKEVFEALRLDQLDYPGVRLEQERIGFGWVEQAVRATWP